MSTYGFLHPFNPSFRCAQACAPLAAEEELTSSRWARGGELPKETKGEPWMKEPWFHGAKVPWKVVLWESGDANDTHAFPGVGHLTP